MKRNLDDWLTGYLELVENTEPCDLFKIWCGVSLICAFLQRKVWFEWEWKIYPNMYIVLVAPSGVRKGTAIRPMKEFLTAAGIRISAESITREALIKDLLESADIRVSGEHNIVHCSLTIVAEELSVLIDQKQIGLITTLTDWFDCSDSWTYRTKHGGSDEIIGVWVNLLGAITPQFLQTALPQDAIGVGLTSRMVLVYSDTEGKICPAPFLTPENRVLRQKLQEDLDQLTLMAGPFTYTKAYFDAYCDWYIESKKHPLRSDRNLQAYSNRRPLHLRKIAMVMSASRSNDMILELEDFERAKRLLDETEKEMHLCFAGRGRAAKVEVFEQMIRYIYNRRTPVSEAELMQKFYKDISGDELTKMLGTAEKAKIISLRHTSEGLMIHLVQKA